MSSHLFISEEEREENKKKKIGNTVGHLEISKQHISVDKTCKNKKKNFDIIIVFSPKAGL